MSPPSASGIGAVATRKRPRDGPGVTDESAVRAGNWGSGDPSSGTAKSAGPARTLARDASTSAWAWPETGTLPG